MILANGTWVSVLVDLSRASPYWSLRSHVTMPVCLESLNTNPAISAKAHRDRALPHCLCPVVALLRWLSLTKDNWVPTLFSPPHIPENNEPKIYEYLEVWTINMASSCITGRKCFCEEKFNVCHSGITSGTCAVCIIYSAKFFCF